jgi:hypothetical protein
VAREVFSISPTLEGTVYAGRDATTNSCHSDISALVLRIFLSPLAVMIVSRCLLLCSFSVGDSGAMLLLSLFTHAGRLNRDALRVADISG